MTIVSFLQKYPLGALSTVNEKGHPELASIYLRVEDTLTMFFVTRTKTRKLKNILANPQVAFIASDEATLTTVEVSGKAYLVEDTMEFARVYDAFHTLFASRPGKRRLPPIVQIQAGKYVACKLIPEQITHRSFSTGARNTKSPKEIILRPRFRTK
jgi:uncharacterized pyridoxamine 5'-phosphate oxidase family protein